MSEVDSLSTVELAVAGAVLDSSDLGIVGVDLDGNHTFVNPAAAKILGYGVDELIGTPSHVRWHQPARGGQVSPADRCAICATYQAGHSRGEDVFWRKDGTSVPVEFVATPLRENGRLVGAVVTFHDIEARTRSEESLRRLNHRLALAHEVGSIGVWDWDLRTNLAECDDRIFDIYGTPRSGVHSFKQWTSAVHPDDLHAVLASLDRAIRNKTKDNVEFRIVRPDGEVRYVQAAQHVVLDDAQNVIRVIGINLDITERKRAEGERERLIASLEEALANVRTLSGFIPICASCKQVRDDKGYWHEVEVYVSDHSGAQFSHALCPQCAERFRDHEGSDKV